MSQVEFDEAMATRVEALYRIGDAVRRRRIVRAALGAASGERVLDVGCGPGFFCAELAEEVGRSGSVVGVSAVGVVMPVSGDMSPLSPSARRSQAVKTMAMASESNSATGLRGTEAIGLLLARKNP